MLSEFKNLGSKLGVSRIASGFSVAGMGPIGMHFADEQLHAVQLRRLGSGKLCLRAWASADYPESRQKLLESPAELKKLVAELLGRSKFHGRKVVSALPPEMTRIVPLAFDASGAEPDANKILGLMKERLDGSISEYVIDYLPVRADSRGSQRAVLVAATRHDEVLHYLNAMAGARLEVAELEVSPAAINRLISQLSTAAAANEIVIMLNFGARKSYLTMVSGRRLLLDKAIDFGSDLVLQKLVSSLNVDRRMAESLMARQGLHREVGDTQIVSTDDLNPVLEIVRPLFMSLTEELRRARLYAAAESQGEHVAQIYALGSVARWPGADTLLSDIAGLPVNNTFPLAAIFDSDDDAASSSSAGVGPELAIATGLALRGLADAE